MGYKVSGYKFLLKDSYLSVPGFHLLYDARSNLVKQGTSEQILNLTDVNEELTVFRNNSVSFSTNLLLDGNLIKAISPVSGLGNAILTKRTIGDIFSYIRTGQPFGVYVITKFKKLSGGGNNLGSAVRFGAFGAGYSGFAITQQGNTSQGTFRLTYSENTTISNQQQPAFSTDYLPINAVNTLAYHSVGNGIPSNNLIYTNNTLRSSYTYDRNFTNLLDRLSICQVENNQDTELFVGQVIVYDWTGYTQSEVTALDLRVRTILEENKIAFL